MEPGDGREAHPRESKSKGLRPPPGFLWQYPAVVDRVTDGDSIVCQVLWRPGVEEHEVEVRLDGYDALEKGQKFGAEATELAASLMKPGGAVMLVARNRREKYGRFLARVLLSDGRDVTQEMLTATASDGVTQLAVPYNP